MKLVSVATFASLAELHDSFVGLDCSWLIGLLVAVSGLRKTHWHSAATGHASGHKQL